MLERMQGSLGGHHAGELHREGANARAERLAVLTTFVFDPTNPDLTVSTADKAEAGVDVGTGGSVVSVVAFHDRISGGVGIRQDLTYLLRDHYQLTDSINGNGIKPEIIQPPSGADTVPIIIQRPANYLTVVDQGIELTATLPEIPRLRTRFQVQGSFVRTDRMSDAVTVGSDTRFSDFQLSSVQQRAPYWLGIHERGERYLLTYRLIHHQPALGLVITATVQHNLRDFLDGIGPRDKRPTTWNMFWGREESNAFGTDEFMEFCRLSGSSPYICINVGSGTVEEAVDWFQYCNGKEPITLVKERTANGHADPYNVKYWSIGNESWGCGGNFTPEDYANRYAEFTTYLSSLAERRNVEFVAVGLEGGDWNRRFFETLASRGRGFFGQRVRNVHQLSIHHYYRDGAAVEFSDKDYYDLLGQVNTVEGVLRRTIGVIDEFTVPQGPTIGIALDEWGVWHPIPNRGDRALFQPNTVRDALLAAVTLNSINSFGTRVSMANIAQTFNVLQSLAFTKGPQMVLTPTYYVFDLFQPHMDAMGMKAVMDSPTYEIA